MATVGLSLPSWIATIRTQLETIVVSLAVGRALLETTPKAWLTRKLLARVFDRFGSASTFQEMSNVQPLLWAFYRLLPPGAIDSLQLTTAYEKMRTATVERDSTDPRNMANTAAFLFGGEVSNPQTQDTYRPFLNVQRLLLEQMAHSSLGSADTDARIVAVSTAHDRLANLNPGMFTLSFTALSPPPPASGKQWGEDPVIWLTENILSPEAQQEANVILLRRRHRWIVNPAPPPAQDFLHGLARAQVAVIGGCGRFQIRRSPLLSAVVPTLSEFKTGAALDAVPTAEEERDTGKMIGLVAQLVATEKKPDREWAAMERELLLTIFPTDTSVPGAMLRVLEAVRMQMPIAEVSRSLLVTLLEGNQLEFAFVRACVAQLAESFASRARTDPKNTRAIATTNVQQRQVELIALLDADQKKQKSIEPRGGALRLASAAAARHPHLATGARRAVPRTAGYRSTTERRAHRSDSSDEAGMDGLSARQNTDGDCSDSGDVMEETEKPQLCAGYLWPALVPGFDMPVQERPKEKQPIVPVPPAPAPVVPAFVARMAAGGSGTVRTVPWMAPGIGFKPPPGGSGAGTVTDAKGVSQIVVGVLTAAATDTQLDAARTELLFANTSGVQTIATRITAVRLESDTYDDKADAHWSALVMISIPATREDATIIASWNTAATDPSVVAADLPIGSAAITKAQISELQTRTEEAKQRFERVAKTRGTADPKYITRKNTYDTLSQELALLMQQAVNDAAREKNVVYGPNFYVWLVERICAAHKNDAAPGFAFNDIVRSYTNTRGYSPSTQTAIINGTQRNFLGDVDLKESTGYVASSVILPGWQWLRALEVRFHVALDEGGSGLASSVLSPFQRATQTERTLMYHYTTALDRHDHPNLASLSVLYFLAGGQARFYGALYGTIGLAAVVTEKVEFFMPTPRGGTPTNIDLTDTDITPMAHSLRVGAHEAFYLLCEHVARLSIHSGIITADSVAVSQTAIANLSYTLGVVREIASELLATRLM